MAEEPFPQADEINRLNEFENHNFAESKKLLGESIEMVQDMVGLYDKLARIAVKTNTFAAPENACALSFMVACRYQFSMALLTLLRIHITDSLFFARKAIELCGFAGLVKRDPDKAKLWLAAGDDDAAYREYKIAFKTGELFPKDNFQWTALYSRYDFASKQVHSSIFGLGRHVEFDHDSEKVSLRFGYFDLKDRDPKHIVSTFMWMIETHFQILAVFEGIFNFSGFARADQLSWEVYRNGFEQRLRAQQARWKDNFNAERVQPQVAYYLL